MQTHEGLYKTFCQILTGEIPITKDRQIGIYTEAEDIDINKPINLVDISSTQKPMALKTNA
jgi:hypothetical protein